MSAAKRYHKQPQNSRLPRRARVSTVVMAALIATTLAALGQLAPGLWSPRWTPLARDPLSSFPHIILWAWERPEVLDFIDPDAVGVAFLAGTLYLSDEYVSVRPRLQPLSVPHGTKLMAVVRIEADRLRPPTLTARERERAAAIIAEVSRLSGIAALQVDFDASVSQRRFYRDVLQELRRQLPDSLPLSMTALASWCIYDDWLAGLPVDEAVPMLFRMDADDRRVRRYVAGEDFRPALCRQSLGIATDEPRPKFPANRRLYIFHPQPWQPDAVQRVLEEIKLW